MGDARAVALPRDLAPVTSEHARMLEATGGRITPTTLLISENALPAIVSELEALCVPTTPERGVEWARFLTGCYPTFKAHDPKVYVRAISSLFAETPEDLCRIGVDRMSRSFKFPPSRAEVHEVLEELRRERMGKIAIAKAMQREHARRREEAQEAERRAEERRKWREKHGDKSPLDVVLSEIKRP
jgi:hypothetical protein